MEEIWKKYTHGDSYYEVSNHGRLRKYTKSTKLIKYIKGVIHPKGYHKVGLGKKGSKYMHRLVCELFVENPDGKPHVNHKDGNKLNNHYTNLEWCTPIENNIHACEVLGITVIIPVYLVNNKNEIVGKYDSKNQLKLSGVNTRGMYVIPVSDYSGDYFNKIHNRPRKKCERYIPSATRGLSEEQVREARSLMSTMIDSHIAMKLGCNSASIRNIRLGKSYLNVK